MGTPDIVIDTNVLIAAQRSRRGASSKLMSLLAEDLFACHVSVPLVLEYEAVLLRQQSILGLDDEDVMVLVDAMCTYSTWHKIYYLWRPMLPDEKDEMLLELAVKAQSDYIVTYNKRDFKASRMFGITVVTPKELLEKIGVIS